MPRHGPQCPQEQRRKRRQRNEYAFLFTPAGHLLHAVERLAREIALADCGGDVASAAVACGLTDIPKGTQALWGRSAAEAWATYRRWQKQRSRPEERQRPAWPCARSQQRGTVQRPRGYLVRL
jgi:hypothetical protein